MNRATHSTGSPKSPRRERAGRGGRPASLVGRYRLPEAPFEQGQESLADAATKTIRDRILDLHLPPGKSIHTKWLLEHLKLSRTPIREALNRLASEGLIHFEKNQGVFVHPLDFAEVDKLMDAFRICERISAFSCDLDDPGLLDDVLAMQTEQRESLRAGRYLDAAFWNFRFRLRIAETCRNHHLIEFYRRTANHTRRLSIMIYRVEARDPAFFEAQLRLLERLHRDIVDALETKDRERLLRVLSEQVSLFRTRISNVLRRGETEAEFPVG